MGSILTPGKLCNYLYDQVMGKAGRKIQLNANFYELKIPTNAIIHHYDVVISDGKQEDKIPKPMARQLMQKFTRSNKKLFRTQPVFDGRKNMYTKEPLDFQSSRKFEGITFQEEGDDRERTFSITLKWVNQLNLKYLQDAMEGRAQSVPQEIYQGLDMVLRYAATLCYVPVGSKFFTSNGSVNLGGGREMWPGYNLTVRPTGRWKLMLNIDTSASGFYRHIPVLQYLNEILPRFDIRRGEMMDRDRKAFERELKGLKIQITYMGKQKRKYRVNGLTKLGASKQTFTLDNNDKVTVQSYFRKEKNVTLKYANLPCLHVGNPQKNVYIPMEVCEMVPGQRVMKKLTEDQTAIMIKNTAKKPEMRKAAIDRIVSDSNYAQDPYVKGFGIQVSQKMTTVDARVINPPDVQYSGGKIMKPSGGAWNMKNIRVFQGANIQAWGMVVCNFFGRPFEEDSAWRFEEELIKKAQEMGINMGRSVFYKVLNKFEDPTKVLSEGFATNKNLDLLVAVLPGKTPFYQCLKRMCETENGYVDAAADPRVQEVLKNRGLSTQCIQNKNAFKCSPMTLAQLLLKVNAKMGGINNSISNNNKVTRPIRVFKEPVLFLGADVTHPGIGDKESPSIAAIVGSVDPVPSKYAVCVRVQKHRQEMIEDMKNVAKDLLKQFRINTKLKPCKIVMYRDGVSEGQFQQVLQHEMRAIQQACSELEKGYQPAITFIVVQKRHHARFFPIPGSRDVDRSGNCLPGTTIDSGVCHPTEYDYYQYSHAGIQGTSRPSHYHVLWDDNDFEPDELQSLSFMLCHLYVRCTRSVSIPAPAYYAHHVAFRAKDHLLGRIDDDGTSSSGRSDVGNVTEDMARLNLREIVKPHPKLISRMYFV
ncbi:protein argonaute-2-like [Clytia hemisphaerica]|uniref:Uncharacterized protein n=1 Tax=Clytia hemisphaerica TaxID=252671 RepID=A0A7M5VDP8_9CNID